MTYKNKYTYLLLGFVLFSFAFLVSRAQFFACPTVEIQNDSGEYVYWIDAYLEKGQLPPNNFIPLGYPVIIKALTSIKDSVYPIIYFQFAFTLISFLVLLFTVWRFYDKTIYIATLLLLCVYVQVPNNLFWDMYIMSESVYTSSLVLLFASLIYFFNATEKKSAVWLSIFLALPILFRPSGIFCFIMLLGICMYLVLLKRKDLLMLLVAPFFIIYLSQSVYSFCATGQPFFLGNRIKMDMIDSLGKGVNAHEDSIFRKIERISYFDKIITTYKNYTNQSQIYTRIDEANQKYFVKNFAHTNQFGCVLNIDSTKVRERKIIFKEFFDSDKMSYLIEREQDVKKTKWFKLYDAFVIYIVKKIFLNVIWVILLFVSLLVSVVLLIQSGFTNKAAWLLACIVAINIGSNLTIIFTSHLPYPRYSYPGEFIFLLQLPFLYHLLIQKTNAFK
jgi:hypothetical protein